MLKFPDKNEVKKKFSAVEKNVMHNQINTIDKKPVRAHDVKRELWRKIRK